MLYNTFKFIMLVSSMMCILAMIDKCEWDYIFFPSACMIWVLYSWFRENDKEFLRMHGLDPNGSYLFPDDSYFSSIYGENTFKHRGIFTYDPNENTTFVGSNHERYMPRRTRREQRTKDYQVIVPRIKRSVRIKATYNLRKK